MSEGNSNIATLLNQILTAIYGKDVRQSIHDAIKQCYSDVGDPALNQDAFKKAIADAIADGSLAALTLEEGSVTTPYIGDKAVTEEKISDSLLAEITSSGYVTDSSGNKYEIYVKDDGTVGTKPYLEIPSEGKIHDIYVKDGKAYDAATKSFIESFVVDGNTFTGDHRKYTPNSGTNLAPEGTECTIVVIARTGKLKDTWITVNADNYPTNMDVTDNSRTFKILGNRYGIYTLLPGFSENSTLVESLYANPDRNFAIFRRRSATVSNDGIFNESVVGQMENIINSTNWSSIYLLLKTANPNQAPIERLIVYNRALSISEMKNIRELLYKPSSINRFPNHYVSGITGLGCPNNIYTRTLEIPRWNDNEINYTKLNWSEPDITTAPTKFTDLIFTDKIDSLEVGDLYNIEAFPFPYKINDSNYVYNVEYSSSAPAVLDCYNGVLIAKTAGTAVITAKISGTSISKELSITVNEKKKGSTNLLSIPESYVDGLYSLVSDSPTSVLRAIKKAIEDTASAGYDGVKFPNTIDYHVAPFQKGINIEIPSNFIIDFSGANMYCHDSEWAKDKGGGYTLFSFGNRTANAAILKSCHNSSIRNLNYYGERYLSNNPNNYYGSYNNFAEFKAGGVEHCKIENINFDYTTGFNITTDQNGFDVWQGTGLDGARRGCTLPSDYQAGRLDEDGETIISDSTGMWYCTPTLLKLGFTYSDDPTASPQMKYYTVGAMGTATRQGSSGWWYELFFYNANQELIEYTGLQMSLDRYLLPEGAVYFKINLASWGKPTIQSQVDVQHVVRLWGVGDPYRCEINNCNFKNIHCSAISFTGGRNCVINNCYIDEGHPFTISNGTYGWSLDFEDGWLAMRHNIVHKVICPGLAANPGGYNTAYVNSIFDSLTASGSAEEALRIINCMIRSVNIKYKTNDYIQGLTYGTLSATISSDVANGTATCRLVNNTQDSNIAKNFIKTKPAVVESTY